MGQKEGKGTGSRAGGDGLIKGTSLRVVPDRVTTPSLPALGRED